MMRCKKCNKPMTFKMYKRAYIIKRIADEDLISLLFDRLIAKIR